MAFEGLNGDEDNWKEREGSCLIYSYTALYAMFAARRKTR